MAQSALQTRRQRSSDFHRSSFAIDRRVKPLRPLLTSLDLSTIDLDRAALASACRAFMRHEFNLLGSGPVLVEHGVECPGIEGLRYPSGPRVAADPSGRWLDGRLNSRNVSEAKRVWSLVDPEYKPIDWQLDFRSGWRWSESTWYRDIHFGTQAGADIKLPWELARLQHLPQLAIAAVLAIGGDGEVGEPADLSREVRNQLLDFVATNPPRFGVNWVTAMDVAIRVSNLLLAHDILASAGIRFEDEVEAVYRRTVFEHASHIHRNIEWDPDFRGNHYLADQVGLIFAGTALNEPEAEEWLGTGSAAFKAELSRQFNPDGSNFEGSTSYHGLSTELAVWAAAVLLSASAPPMAALPAGFAGQLAGMLAFSRAITGPDGRVVQIGDSDSGRFVCLAAGRDPLSHERLIDASAGLFGSAASSRRGVDRVVIAALAQGTLSADSAPERDPTTVRVGDPAAFEDVAARIRSLGPNSKATYAIPLGEVGPSVDLLAFPDGGFWVARSNSFQLVIRCGRIGQNGLGGHDHDDQLSFDLWIGAEHVIADPGTFVYTSLPAARNRYRSAESHSGPWLAGPPVAGLDSNLFALDRPARGTCLAWGPFGFAARRRDRFGRESLACISWSSGAIEVMHGVEGGELESSRLTADWRCLTARVRYSPGYGLVSP